MQNHSDDKGISYGWVFLLIFLFLGAITILTVYTLENSVMTIINDFISQGSVSTQTAQAIEWNRNITMALPVFAIFGALLWSINRGVAGRDGLGIPASVFMQGWIILLSCCIVGFMMSFLGGTVIDRFFTGLDNAGLIDNPDIMTEKWADAQQSTMWTFINGYYTLCFLCPLLGFVIFVMSVVKKTYGSRYTAGY